MKKKHTHAIIGIAQIVLALFLYTKPVHSTEFEKITDDVYRYRVQLHHSLVIVTSEGAVVVDPLVDWSARRLKNAIKTLTSKPVTHVIFSHSDLDHASGGLVFADTAKFIAQANAPAKLDGVAPDIRFQDEHTFTVGGKTIELTYLGPGQGTAAIAIIVRPDNVLFLVDVASPSRLVYGGFLGANIDQWIAQIKKAEKLNFDIFVPGHGRVGKPEELPNARKYMEDLRGQVLAALKKGRNNGLTAEKLIQDINLEKYKDWAHYQEWRIPNILGMANYLVRAGFVR